MDYLNMLCVLEILNFMNTSNTISLNAKRARILDILKCCIHQHSFSVHLLGEIYLCWCYWVIIWALNSLFMTFMMGLMRICYMLLADALNMHLCLLVSLFWQWKLDLFNTFPLKCNWKINCGGVRSWNAFRL